MTSYRRHIRFILVMLCASYLNVNYVSAQSKSAKYYTVGFYNVENLFDTIDNTTIKDEEFLPDGKKNWNSTNYNDKLANIASVISQLGKDKCPDGFSLLGLSEIENDTVIKDLISHPLLASRNLDYVHYDSPDARGIDVGLIYDADVFSPTRSSVHPVKHPDDEEARKTRDVLLVEGLLGDEKIYITVNHWPSRSGGEKRSLRYRNQAALVNRNLVNSILLTDPSANIIIVGDLNDDPTSESVAKYLRAKKKIKQVGPDDLYNPMHNYYKKGHGSNAYRDRWSLFDQVIVSHGLVDNSDEGLQFVAASIFKKNYLVQKFGQYKGYPKRTFDGDVYQGGFSDHFPVFIYLSM